MWNGTPSLTVIPPSAVVVSFLPPSPSMVSDWSWSYHLPTLLLLILLVFGGSVSADRESEKAALLLLKNATGGATVFWNPSTDPCHWRGVNCSNYTGVIIFLQLPGSGLNGVIPAGVFGNLTGLKTLSLRRNNLSGPLPSDLALCRNLTKISLQSNDFSGDISVLVALKGLIRLNISENRFSGVIPAEICDLRSIRTLYLQNNNLTGQLPADLDLPKLDKFNVSYNNLSGPIPFKLQSRNASEFIGTSLCGGPRPPCPEQPAPPPVLPPPPTAGGGEGEGKGKGKGEGNKKNKLSGGAIAGIVIACSVGLLLFFILLFCLCRKRNTTTATTVESGTAAPANGRMDTGNPREGENSGGISAEIPSSNSTAAVATISSSTSTGAKGPSPSKKLCFIGAKWDKTFNLEDMLKASAEVLGKGTFGTSYKALLEMGATVAVKRLKEVNLPEMEFKERIEVLGKMDHPNIVPLRAYYYSDDEKLLVYDFIPMGSLSALLHGEHFIRSRGSGRTPLDWDTRLAIAFGAAQGLEYIHSIGPLVSHGNLKASNILLLNSEDACVSDHGLSQLAKPTISPNRITGYRAPEVTNRRDVPQKADVYSFGVLLIELVSGKAPEQALINDDGVDLPRWVKSVPKEEWENEVLHMELLRYQTVNDEMVQLLQIAVDCTDENPDERPTMSEVVARIEVIQNSSVDPDEFGR